ncbi:MAG: tRNA (adenosine(37)-N6)-threonylcarbamoyltransferase complex ATPase subunit type 1 TsaE [Candidatus Wolfebacteria bacterium]|nr:tRNA (adenosine(37)-N6)-threonylcarbamoyltransferase complex ATPase subunit type 1 TsaE [Candidatus Wolfebacteria bacterium]
MWLGTRKQAHKLNSLKESKKLAEELADKLSKKASIKNALVLALSGDLGSGKTTFTQNFLRHLGVKQKITSPTFVLLKRYKIYDLRFKNAYHVDAYRIKNPKEMDVLGFKEILKNPRNVVLIEWAENIKKILPRNTIWLKFEHGEKENIRKVQMFS